MAKVSYNCQSIPSSSLPPRFPRTLLRIGHTVHPVFALFLTVGTASFSSHPPPRCIFYLIQHCSPRYSVCISNSNTSNVLMLFAEPQPLRNSCVISKMFTCCHSGMMINLAAKTSDPLPQLFFFY